MKKTFQSFVFGCRVNEAERISFDRKLREAGFTVDLTNPAFCIINTCAITGKAEREAKQLVYSLKKRYPETLAVITGCSATYWKQRFPAYAKLADIVIPNIRKNRLVEDLLKHVQPLLTTTADTVQTDLIFDKFRHSNRLLVKIQDGCHRFCNYCIVPYLRGTPQSQTIAEIVSYINSFDPLPSEVVLSAINTEAFGKDTGESLVTLVKEVLQKTKVPRIGFGSVHPWSINAAFLEYYKKTLSKEKRFIHFFHVPIQSGSQPMLDAMRREYAITDVIRSLEAIKKIRPDAFIATDVIVGYLGETDDLFAETYTTLQKSPISRFHVFPFSNRAHTAAFYMKKRIAEVSAADKKKRATALRTLSNQKYTQFVETLMGKEYDALVVERTKRGTRLLLDNNVEYVTPKDALPGDIIHVKMESSLDASLRS